ncbi:MAG: isochorismatase family cysteine hydrolase [Candidatus Micrarchaeia archaeon]
MTTRKVYAELGEIVAPEHTALVVWDVQNMLVSRVFNKEEFMQNTSKLIEAARKNGVPIFFTKITPLPQRFESKARLATMRNWGQLDSDPSAFELAIKPDAEEVVINKNTASLFIGTNFELMARNAGIETIVFAGIATEIGIESSAREALNRGFYAVVAKDAVSSGDKDAHERSLANMSKLLVLASSDDIINSWG